MNIYCEYSDTSCHGTGGDCLITPWNTLLPHTHQWETKKSNINLLSFIFKFQIVSTSFTFAWTEEKKVET